MRKHAKRHRIVCRGLRTGPFDPPRANAHAGLPVGARTHSLRSHALAALSLSQRRPRLRDRTLASPRSVRDLSETFPGPFRYLSGTFPRPFRDLSETLPSAQVFEGVPNVVSTAQFLCELGPSSEHKGGAGGAVQLAAIECAWVDLRSGKRKRRMSEIAEMNLPRSKEGRKDFGDEGFVPGGAC